MKAETFSDIFNQNAETFPQSAVAHAEQQAALLRSSPTLTDEIPKNSESISISQEVIFPVIICSDLQRRGTCR